MQLVRARSYIGAKVIFESAWPLQSGYQVFAIRFQWALP
jgi:hypothetical protein